jgi:hypothetical protein
LAKIVPQLRSSRETELLEEFPVHVVALWMGHDAKVSLKHYAQTTEDHFVRATGSAKSGAPKAQKVVQQVLAGIRRESKQIGVMTGIAGEYADSCDWLRDSEQMLR